MLNLLVTAIATLGVGKIPKAPGTWGSVLAMLIWWALIPLSVSLQVLLIFSAFVIGWVATHFYEKWNNRHDPKEVVVDELIGMWLALAGNGTGWLFVLSAFLLFRLFDIWKPFPVGYIDRHVPGATGTIMDDVLAGAMAWTALVIVELAAWSLGFELPYWVG